MNLKINNKLEIPTNEIQWKFSRSLGADGQNINKIDRRVEIIFNVSESKTSTPYQKHMIKIQDAVKLINDYIYLVVQQKRTQYQNRKRALDKLALRLRELIKPPPKKRKETIPTRSSQRKRVESKKKLGKERIGNPKYIIKTST